MPFDAQSQQEPTHRTPRRFYVPGDGFERRNRNDQRNQIDFIREVYGNVLQPDAQTEDPANPSTDVDLLIASIQKAASPANQPFQF
jgi:hypothetical protein